MIPVEHYLALGAILFLIGAGGALLRRNSLIIFMSIELMLTAVNINLIAFSRVWGAVHGQLFSLFIMADATAQTALALGIVVSCASLPRAKDIATRHNDGRAADDTASETLIAEAETPDGVGARMRT
jgi:NADH-quinone oxidoreductase subunit K